MILTPPAYGGVSSGVYTVDMRVSLFRKLERIHAPGQHVFAIAILFRFKST